jgi:transcriptional regulator with XRE-family HTH domain
LHPVAVKFAENLMIARGRAGFSHEELGFRADLHRTAVGQLERGRHLARIDSIVKLAGALSIPPGDLLAGMRWRPAELQIGSFKADTE